MVTMLISGHCHLKTMYAFISIHKTKIPGTHANRFKLCMRPSEEICLPSPWPGLGGSLVSVSDSSPGGCEF